MVKPKAGAPMGRGGVRPPRVSTHAPALDDATLIDRQASSTPSRGSVTQPMVDVPAERPRTDSEAPTMVRAPGAWAPPPPPAGATASFAPPFRATAPSFPPAAPQFAAPPPNTPFAAPPAVPSSARVLLPEMPVPRTSAARGDGPAPGWVLPYVIGCIALALAGALVLVIEAHTLHHF